MRKLLPCGCDLFGCTCAIQIVTIHFRCFAVSIFSLIILRTQLSISPNFCSIRIDHFKTVGHVQKLVTMIFLNLSSDR